MTIHGLENKFIVNGFLVERAPSLDERFNTEWSNPFSLPVRDPFTGEYSCKPEVFFDKTKKKWGIRFNGVYNSEFLVAFGSAAEANDVVRRVLATKR